MKSSIMRKALIILVAFAILLPMVWPVATAPAQDAAAQPATRPAADISPDAKPLLDEVVKAYTQLKTLRLAGKINAKFDVQQQQEDQSADFTASYAAPDAFRHSVEGNVTAGSTGDQAYVHSSRANAYMNAPAPKEKVTADKLPSPLGEVLNAENPSLMLAVSADPRHELTDNVQSITLGDPVQIDGREHPVLHLSLIDGPEMDLRIDPQTHLLRQVWLNLKPSLEKQGAVDVKEAQMTIDYTTSEAGIELLRDSFAWTPPAGAKDIAEMRRQQDQGMQEMLAALDALKGKPAPDITLTTPEGKQMKLAELKGSPVLLDFWATWCAPCIASMPNVEAIHREKGGAGLKVFAVNIGEEKADVEDFVKEQGWQIPLLYDPTGASRTAFDGGSAIPFQVLIDKEGVIKQAIVGAGGPMKANMDRAIDELVK